jgi:hypothetical protein
VTESGELVPGGPLARALLAVARRVT